MTLKEQIKRNCVDLPVELVEIIPWLSMESPPSGKVIMFMLAGWSAPSLQSFRLLTKEIAAMAQPPRLLVIDVNDLDADGFEQRFGHLPQGMGEAYWFKDRVLIRSDQGYRSAAITLLRQNLADF